MEAVNPKMLVITREARGLTQNQLVEKIPNLNQGNYSKMEKGFLPVPKETLINIAKVLDFQVSFYYKKEVNTPISSFYYRKRVSIGKKDLSVLEAKLDIIRMMVDELLDSVDIPEFKLPQYEVTDNLSPSAIAMKTREFLKLPRGPITNLVEILEAAGIIIYFFKIDSLKFDGITLITDNGQPIIFINEALSNDRKNFTIAHELSHLISHIPFAPLPVGRNEETEANEFAGEFLMPYLDCRNDLMNLKYSQLGVLKSYWKVSKAAIAYRAKSINGITSDRYTYLNIELSKNGEKKKETGFIGISEPKLIPLIIDVHENQLGYSLSEMLHLLGINQDDYFEYFNKSKHKIDVRPKKVFDLATYAKNS